MEKNVADNGKAALPALEEDITHAMTASRLPIAIHRNGSILFVNVAALKLIGAKRLEDVVGRPTTDFADASFIPTVKERRKQFEAGVILGPTEGKLRRLDGTTFDASITSIVIDYLGAPASMIIVFDLSHELARETAIITQAELLKRLMELTAGREMRMIELKDIISKGGGKK